MYTLSWYFVAVCLLRGITIIMGERGYYSPARHIRAPLLRAVYQRMLDDERTLNDDHKYWYSLNTTLVAEETCQKFIHLHQDEETQEFLRNCSEKSEWIFTQIGHSFAKSFLSWFMSSTSVNGLLRRGSMFVFSDGQLQQLLQITPDYRGKNMIDLGAGDGTVTEKMAKYFDNVYTTEMSSTMVWRLKERGYINLSVDEWSDGRMTYDLIGCLNLLDRCDKPITVLHTIKKALTPKTGRAIVAVVLPYRPYVEHNSTDHKPSEVLIIQGQTFEEQCQCFIKAVFEPAGFEVERFSRLPYLCEGDLYQSFYLLTDAVFVIKPRDDG